MYHLAKNNDVLEKVYSEVSQVLGSGPGAGDLTVADLHKLPYLMKVVKEIFRYYPPAGQVYTRISTAEDIVGGYQVNASTTFLIHAGSIQQDQRFWENPKQFNPDRFDKPITDHAYIPFGGGKKGCPAANIATQTITTYVAYIARNFEWTYEGKDDPPVIRMGLSAETQNPFRFRLHSRVPHKDEL